MTRPSNHFTNPRDRRAQRNQAQVLERAERQSSKRQRRLTDEQLAQRAVTEAELQRWVIDQARSLGWGVTLAARKALLEETAGFGVDAPPLDGLLFHPRYSLGSEPGWPDLTLIRRRDRRLIFAELKSEKGQLSVRQAEVLELLRMLVLDRDDYADRVAAVLHSRPVGVSPRDSGWATWRDALPRIEVHVWRPSDLSTIAEVLR